MNGHSIERAVDYADGYRVRELSDGWQVFKRGTYVATVADQGVAQALIDRLRSEEKVSHNQPFRKGERVQLHAATDQWMRGDRYGTVVGYGREAEFYDTDTKERGKVRPVRVRLDKSGRVMRFHPDNLFSLGEDDPDVSVPEAPPGRRPRVVRHAGPHPMMHRDALKKSPVRRRMKFFQEHAGGIVGESAKSALALSRAEDWASAEGVTFTWDPETDIDDSWMTPEDRRRPHEVYVAIARHPDGRVASLGNIFDPDTAYQRVVNAELAMELMNQ